MIPVNNADDLMEFLGYFEATDGNFYRKAYEGKTPEMERWGVADIQLNKSFLEEQNTLVFSRDMQGNERMLAPVRTEMYGINSGMNLLRGNADHTLYIHGSDEEWTVIDLNYKSGRPYASLSGLFVGTWKDALTSFLSDSKPALIAHYADFMAQRTDADLLSRSAKNSEIAARNLIDTRKRMWLQLEAIKAEHIEVFNVLHKARENKAALDIMQHPDYDEDHGDIDFPLSYYLTDHANPVLRKDNSFDYVLKAANARIKKSNSVELARSNWAIWRTVKEKTERYAEYDRHNGIWTLV